MIKYIQNDRLQLFWVGLHVAVGYFAAVSTWVVIIWFYLFVASTLVALYGKLQTARHQIIFLLAYVLGFEVIGRGAGAQPYMPDQLGKYFAFAFFSLGLLLGGPLKKVSVFGALLLLLGVPGLLTSLGIPLGKIVFNYFGVFTLALGVLFCSRQVMTFVDYKHLCRFILLPIISLSVFTFFKSTEFGDVVYSTTANFQSGGGSITNQSSTIMGCGIALLLYAILSRQVIFSRRWLDYAVLSLLLVRGLLTFSRGGMVTAVVVIILIIVFPKAKAAWQDTEVRLRKVKVSLVFLMAAIAIGGFFLINLYTNNFLLYRYQSKTLRSLQTGFEKEKNLDDLTSGRYRVLISDLEMFADYPILGTGIGNSTPMRTQYGMRDNILPHVEVSRLMAEQGIFGLAMAILLLVYPVYKAFKEPNNYRKGIMILFFSLALLSTFHSAMRTMISPLLYAFAFIHFVPSNFDWRRALRKASAPEWEKQEALAAV